MALEDETSPFSDFSRESLGESRHSPLVKNGPRHVLDTTDSTLAG
jgi:hypothetical protein